MNHIQQILKSNNSIIVFDVDGVLAKLEFGKYNHHLNDKEFEEINKAGMNPYTEDKVIKKMQKFLSNKNMDNMYVCSQACFEEEKNNKNEYLTKYYNFKKENIFYVYKNEEKLDILNHIKSLYQEMDDKNFAFVDDLVTNLDYVMNNSNYTTIHISSFLD